MAGDCAALHTSTAVLADLGWFASRDELFATHGQTLCGAARMLADPLLSRFSAGAGSGSPSARAGDQR